MCGRSETNVDSSPDSVREGTRRTGARGPSQLSQSSATAAVVQPRALPAGLTGGSDDKSSPRPSYEKSSPRSRQSSSERQSNAEGQPSPRIRTERSSKEISSPGGGFFGAGPISTSLKRGLGFGRSSQTSVSFDNEAGPTGERGSTRMTRRNSVRSLEDGYIPEALLGSPKPARPRKDVFAGGLSQLFDNLLTQKPTDDSSLNRYRVEARTVPRSRPDLALISPRSRHDLLRAAPRALR